MTKNSNLIAAKLLVVEDENEMRDLLVEDLASLGAEVMGAANGQIALNLLSRETFHLVLTDIRMPVMDGLTLLKRTRERDDLTPFMILTAFNEQRYTVEALRLGALDFIEKPFKRAELHAAVRRWLEFGVMLKEAMAADDASSAADPRFRKVQSEILKLKTINRHLKKLKVSGE